MRGPFAVVALTCLALGCRKSAPPSDGTPTPASATVIPSNASATSATPGSLGALLSASRVPRPPGDLAKVKLGGTEEEAKKAAPEVMSALGYHPGGLRDVTAWVHVDDSSKRVVSIRLVILSSITDVLAFVRGAWGDAQIAADPVLQRSEYFWFDPAGGIRARVDPGIADDTSLVFEAYLPTEKLLGISGVPVVSPAQFGFETRPLLGSSLDELKATFGSAVVEESAAEAEATQEKIGVVVGDPKLKEKLGPAQASVHLELPPTEYEATFTWVNVDFDSAGKVKSFDFPLSYEDYPAFQAISLALLKKKLGEPKTEKDLLDREVLVFGVASAPGKGPKITVADDDIVHAWRVRVTRDWLR